MCGGAETNKDGSHRDHSIQTTAHIFSLKYNLATTNEFPSTREGMGSSWVWAYQYLMYFQCEGFAPSLKAMIEKFGQLEIVLS